MCVMVFCTCVHICVCASQCVEYVCASVCVRACVCNVCVYNRPNLYILVFACVSVSVYENECVCVSVCYRISL